MRETSRTKILYSQHLKKNQNAKNTLLVKRSEKLAGGETHEKSSLTGGAKDDDESSRVKL